MKIKLDSPIIVEGKYDKIRLENIFETPIIITEGFGIFKNKDKKDFIKLLAQKSGIIVLTDSDSAGIMIRNHLKSFVPNDKIINIYLPEISGKERRKSSPSKQGILGVEGIDDDIIVSAFERAGVVGTKRESNDKITKLDLYNLGIVGGEQSAKLRSEILAKLSLPTGLSATSMLEAINFLYTKEEFLKLIKGE
jgi:ribonuclease M5